MEKMSQTVPNGYQVLQEGKAQILYKEEKLEIDENNMIKTNKGKRQANKVNEVRGAVFYNPVQEFNRDLSILTIREFNKVRQEELAAKKKEQQGLSILEALSATGLRSVRYLKEIDNINLLVANDIDPAATELMQKNFNFNSIPKENYQIFTEDAIDLMNSMRKQKKFFDVVDLDPYGTAVPFLESALSSIKDGGLLAVTFTDMAVLCARNPHVCFYKYGSIPLGKKYCHEMALRIVLHMISTMANKYQKYIEPQLSITVDFYIRLFIRVKDGAQECHNSILKYAHVFQCLSCEAHYLQNFGIKLQKQIDVSNQELSTRNKKKREQKQKHKEEEKDDHQEQLHEHEEEGGEDEIEKIGISKFSVTKHQIPTQCKVCDGPLIMGGPIWNAKIHNIDFVKRLFESCRDQDEQIKENQNLLKLQTSRRIQAILTGIIDEDICANPLSYEFNQIISQLKTTVPRKAELIAAFRSLNYIIVQSYYDPALYKTNASPEQIYDIFKQWKLKSCNNDRNQLFKNINEQSPAFKILSKPPQIEPNFNVEQVQQLIALEKAKIKYLPNPAPNWGPKSRATGNKNKDEKE